MFLYNLFLYVYSYPGYDITYAFPFVEYPSVECSRFNYAACIDEVNEIASDPDFFDDPYVEHPNPAPSNDLYTETHRRMADKNDFGSERKAEARRRLSSTGPSPSPASSSTHEQEGAVAEGGFPVYFDINFDEVRRVWNHCSVCAENIGKKMMEVSKFVAVLRWRW